MLIIKKMARPRNCRTIADGPEETYFKPKGVPMEDLEETVLLLDEFEAIKLADYEGLYQEEAARRMNVSRQTFGRIIESARGKVATMLVEGKALRIVGGVVTAATGRKGKGDHCMKLALPAREGIIDAHFGHCEYYLVYTVENDSIVSEEKVVSPQGCGCKSNIASTLAAMGVTLMLAGNMGDGAVRVLSGQGIRVVRGCSGSLRAVAESWLAGTLKDSGETCHAHESGAHESGAHDGNNDHVCAHG